MFVFVFGATIFILRLLLATRLEFGANKNEMKKKKKKKKKFDCWIEQEQQQQ